MQHSGESIASIYLVSLIWLRFVLLGAIVAENRPFANALTHKERWWPRCWSMGNLLQVTVSTLPIFMHERVSPFSSHYIFTDLQSFKPIWRAETGNNLESLFISLRSHESPASDCELQCCRNIQLFGIGVAWCTHRMVPQRQIYHKWWCSG